ncbi:hypothetical protein G5I_08307 [Acromyrmex echinatior]|uniref:Uncharacterized protein n=1 Tax=Acromyrmex echinatior TaxID=103372 RepID=F4WR52_ACREC|nr:hypothetical protein G5I_08307 [Acromyrmex echinatior]
MAFNCLGLIYVLQQVARGTTAQRHRLGRLANRECCFDDEKSTDTNKIGTKEIFGGTGVMYRLAGKLQLRRHTTFVPSVPPTGAMHKVLHKPRCSRPAIYRVIRNRRNEPFETEKGNSFFGKKR